MSDTNPPCQWFGQPCDSDVEVDVQFVRTGLGLADSVQSLLANMPQDGLCQRHADVLKFMMQVALQDGLERRESRAGLGV